MTRTALLIFATLFAASACAESFEEYSKVSGLRVLGMRATPPDVMPTETTTLDALVTTDASYQWSWCPLPFVGPSEDVCPVTEAELAELIASSGSDAEAPPFDLGSEPSASFEHSVPPELLAAICEAFANQELPEGVPRPVCDGRFEITVRLVVTAPEATIAGTRELGLLYIEERVANQNPRIVGGEISVRGAPPFVLSRDAPTTVFRDVEYRIALEVDEGSPEPFPGVDDAGMPITELENLAMSWFYEGGEMDKERSSFVEGVTDLANLGENFFRTPLAADYPSEASRLFFVLRDERGGIDWAAFDLELVE